MDSRGEIFFRCTACRRRLAADAGAAGHLLNCPNCRASLRVPESSTAADPLAVRRRVTTLVVLAGFLACGVAGWALARRVPGEPPGRIQSVQTRVVAPATGKTRTSATQSTRALRGDEARAAASEVAAAPQAVQQLQEENRAISRQYEELANWILSNLRGRFLLKQQHVGKLRFAPVNEDFSLNAELADFLAVNSNESALMNDVFQFSRDSLVGLQQTYMTATQDAPDRVTLHIPPFEREGAALREELYGALQGVLGSDRFGRLLEVGEKDLTRSFDYFGTASRTLVFESVTDPRVSAKPYLLIRDGWVIPQDESRRTTETSEEAVTELPARYNSYLAWLPDFIAAYAKP